MNKENLLKMADYLETLEPEKFDISSYTKEGDGSSRDIEYLCGSVGCVIGHAPRVFGVEECDYSGHISSKYLLIDWLTYSTRIFRLLINEWEWCFSGGWEGTDNTPKGASLRMRYLVENGLPEDSFDQRSGLSTYMFKEQIDKPFKNIK